MMAITINKDGYHCVNLTNANHTRKTERVHRLVALAFIPNPDNKPEVNHKNCIRGDNRIENLEWMTREENITYISQCGNKSNKKIKCIETGEIFNTSTEVSKTNGGDSGNIRKSARSQGKYGVHGFHYIYI